MKLAEVESKLGIDFPSRHRLSLLDPLDPIREHCDFLELDSPHAMMRLIDRNEALHDAVKGNGWPVFLIAFASNGCGDFFAYDLREDPYRIRCIEPDRAIEEQLTEANEFVFDSFEKWYRYKVALCDRFPE